MLRCTFVFLSLSTYFSESYSIYRVLDERIVGGWPANITEYPFVLAIEMTSLRHDSQFCGASIIGDSWALTAAHCVNGISPDKLRLRSGSSFRASGGETHNVHAIIVHPKYMSKRDYDIALIKVSNRFLYSDVVQPIQLAQRSPSAGTSVVVLGWGSLSFGGTKPDQLQQVVVDIMDPYTCYQRYKDHFRIKTHMLCANVPSGGKDACQGDSGGSLLADGELAGIVSWGGVCGDKFYPGVYSDVAYFRPWVTKVTGIM